MALESNAAMFQNNPLGPSLTPDGSGCQTRLTPFSEDMHHTVAPKMDVWKYLKNIQTWTSHLSCVLKQWFFMMISHCVPPILTKEIAITECEQNIAEPRPPNCFTLPPISAGVRWRSYRWMNGCKYGKKNWQFRQSICILFIVFVFFRFLQVQSLKNAPFFFFWVGGGACSVL